MTLWVGSDVMNMKLMIERTRKNDVAASGDAAQKWTEIEQIKEEEEGSKAQGERRSWGSLTCKSRSLSTSGTQNFK